MGVFDSCKSTIRSRVLSFSGVQEGAQTFASLLPHRNGGWACLLPHRKGSCRLSPLRLPHLSGDEVCCRLPKVSERMSCQESKNWYEDILPKDRDFKYAKHLKLMAKKLKVYLKKKNETKILNF